MFDYNAGGRRPVNDPTRAKRLAAANDLVRRTLAQHGLAPAALESGASAPQDLMDLLRKSLPNGFPRPTMGGNEGPPLPEGALFLSASHAGISGSRNYRTYVPSNAADGVTGVVMMLHGCTQTPEDFALGTGMNALAETNRFVVVYPEQCRGANAQSCWSWFRPADQARDRGEPEILAGIARLTMEQYSVPPRRCLVAGLSAGGAMAVVLGATYPDVFAAAGVHSGLPYQSARDLPSAFATMADPTSRPLAQMSRGIPTIVFHGSADKIVHPGNGVLVAQAAENAGPPQSVRTTRNETIAGRACSVTIDTDLDGRPLLEHWEVEGLGHAWSGGRPEGSYTDPRGPDASAEMVRFFLELGA